MRALAAAATAAYNIALRRGEELKPEQASGIWEEVLWLGKQSGTQHGNEVAAWAAQ